MPGKKKLTFSENATLDVSSAITTLLLPMRRHAANDQKVNTWSSPSCYQCGSHEPNLLYRCTLLHTGKIGVCAACGSSTK